MEKLTNTIDLYLVKKVPALPKNIKELLVQFAPWITIVAIVFSLPVILAFLGLGAMFYAVSYPGYGMAAAGFNYTLAIIFLIISLVLMGLSVPGLFARSKKGWNMVYYSILVSAVYSLISFNFFSLIIGTLISLYLIFQVREYYK